jgi:branched-chain amino acid transport system ATP-binding protein
MEGRPLSVLAVRRLSKSFGGVRAVDDVSFEVEAGEFLALIGPNGAGKSTCFNMVNGQIAPDTGQILIDGHDIAGATPRRIWRMGVGRTFQIAATFGSMTVAENVQMALLSHAGQIFGLWTPVARRQRERALELLALVGIGHAADKACRELAYGDIKRVELAIALANDPKLLLMDEPTAGMATRERNDLIALVKRLVADQGISVLFTEHSMDVVFAFADRIIVLARGKLIAGGDAQAIREDPKVQEVYFGTGKSFEAKRAEPSPVPKTPETTSVAGTPAGAA